MQTDPIQEGQPTSFFRIFPQETALDIFLMLRETSDRGTGWKPILGFFFRSNFATPRQTVDIIK